LWGGFYGACLGAWLGVIPIPLDWDQPWQAWPITVYYGSTIGWIVGTAVSPWVFSQHMRAE